MLNLSFLQVFRKRDSPKQSWRYCTLKEMEATGGGGGGGGSNLSWLEVPSAPLRSEDGNKRV